MDKRGTRILIGCILCTLIVFVLFIIALRLARPGCELISIEPQQLRRAQLEAFNAKRSKPVRSHDKSILFKISAYLEYNLMAPTSLERAGSGQREQGLGPAAWPASGQHGVQAQAQPPPLGLFNGTRAPSPSSPQLGFTGQQLHNASLAANQQTALGGFGPASSPYANQRAERRFLPLQLDSVETRGVRGLGAEGETGQAPLANGTLRQRYILSFNCSRLNMVLAFQGDRVHVEAMSMELNPASLSKATCELQLPITGAFSVDSSAPTAPGPGPTGNQHNNSTSNNNNNNNHSHNHHNYARYFCNKPLSYNCYHYSSKSGPSQSNGLLLAVLHINAIEYETATLGGPGAGAKGEARKHIKHEFKSKRKECDVSGG